MKLFKVTELATGKTVEYTSEQIKQEHLNNLFKVEEIGIAAASLTDEKPVYRGSWFITKLSFRNRFTQEEKITIELASLDDTSAPMEKRALAAVLRVSQNDITVAQYVDLKMEKTRTGVLALEQYGLLSKGRALEILDTPPLIEELYHG
jgi:hypothetical protein